jgi:hypothetical protein
MPHYCEQLKPESSSVLSAIRSDDMEKKTHDIVTCSFARIVSLTPGCQSRGFPGKVAHEKQARDSTQGHSHSSDALKCVIRISQLFQRYAAALCNNIPNSESFFLAQVPTEVYFKYRQQLGRSHQREARSTIEVGPLGYPGVFCVANRDTLGGRNALFRLGFRFKVCFSFT